MSKKQKSAPTTANKPAPAKFHSVPKHPAMLVLSIVLLVVWMFVLVGLAIWG